MKLCLVSWFKKCLTEVSQTRQGRVLLQHCHTRHMGANETNHEESLSQARAQLARGAGELEVKFLQNYREYLMLLAKEETLRG